MHADARKLLWDAQQAAARIARFTAGKGFADYEADEYLRSAVERQFEIIGEALNRLARVDALVADQIPELPRIIAFRNVFTGTPPWTTAWFGASSRPALARCAPPPTVCSRSREHQPGTMIRDHIAANLTIEPNDFEYAPFSQQGGLGKVHQLFGDKLNTIIEESNESLAA
jgi:hypothetical protein